MDICFLPAWFYDIEGNGGGLFFREQAVAMRERVEQVSIFYPYLAPRYLGKRRWSLTEEQGVPVFKYQGFAFPKRISVLRGVYRKEIRRAFALFLHERGGKQPDLLHAHSLWGAYAAMVINARWGIPFVYTEHLGKWTQTGYLLPAHHLQQLTAISTTAAAITAVSSGLARRIDDFISEQTVLTTPNLVDTDYFSPAAVTNEPSDTFQLIAIGDPWRTKGLDLLIQAIGIAQRRTEKRLQLTLVDKIPGRDQLRPYISQYKLGDQIRFTGRLDRTALRDLLRTQHLLVSASRRESFGLTMVEGLASGLPVLASRTAGAQDIVRPACGMLVDIDDADQLAAGILLMLAGHHRYAPTQLAEYARTHFGKRGFQERWIGIYSRILTAG